MRPKQLLSLIAEGESTVLEFKRKAVSPQKLAKEFVAFCNTLGGYLLIGIDDDGSVVGVKSEKSEIDIVETACKIWIEPPITAKIEIIALFNKDIIVCRIEQGEQKPYKLMIEENGEKSFKPYIRIGEKCIEASREMNRLMSYRSDKTSFVKLSIGENEKRLFVYLENYEQATVSDFAKLVNISTRRAERLLIRLVRAGVLQIHNDATRDYFTLLDPK